MTVLALLLALVALVLFVVAAFDRNGTTDARGRTVAFVPLGLAFLTAALICQFCAFGGDRIGA